jgi:glycosyltransferase involved in cell wall biosynthesis/spore maturation protein CgeB
MEDLSIVRRAHSEYSSGNYASALSLYRQAGELLGDKNFRANIWLCQKRLAAMHGRLAPTIDQLAKLKVAAVMDEFTYHSYAPECNLRQLTSEGALDELETFQPDLLFIESAWRGKDELWNRKIGTLSHELKKVLEWCRERHVPTVFWNKEDPIHFETFLTTAQQFDHVFTTDIDCIARYKAALGHERVYLLPFACQPKIHNPVELYVRKDAFCFAGAYYVRYPERTRDLENYVAELPKFKPLEIFDRNFGKDDVNYKFPPSYEPYIVGTLPFDEIDKAYKGYRYAINLNSIKQSQTMFARRVYELLGSNTITISNFSRGVRLLFGDLVIASDSGKEVVDRLGRMDEEASAKFRLAGLRKVMQEHTYGHRLAYVASKAFSVQPEVSVPTVLCVAQADSAQACQRLIVDFLQQTHPHRRLIIVANEGVEIEAISCPDDQRVSILKDAPARRLKLRNVLKADAWFSVWSADDYHGPNYLLDLAIATRYAHKPLVGKAERYQLSPEGITRIGHDQAYRECGSLPKRASLVNGESVLSQYEELSAVLSEADGDWLMPGLATDPFNFCQDGAGATDQARARIDDLALDTGIPVEQLIKVAESIPPSSYDEFNVPKWGARKLLSVFGANASQHVSLEAVPGGLSIRSTLREGEHEYIYAKNDLALNDLPSRNPIKAHLDLTPGLNVQYVIVFLDTNKKKLSHVIHTANRNYSVEAPEGTQFIRLGWRVLGPGTATVGAWLWEHRKLEPAQVLGRSSTLLLTNHYPSYSDLYRNAFVHSRVRAYRQRGAQVDVFRLREDEAVSYAEFQDVDVITGSSEALQGMLASGRYQHVLVHFLSPAMWDVLKHYPEIRIVIWVHGAEIQPWHRREYTYQNEVERAKAQRDSEQRMAFWRGILNPLPPNLRLVFVSRYFAEEVMEDLGFRLPDSAYSIIHNPIDTDLFSYQPKPVVQRKKVLSIRSFASPKYANDLSVAAILEVAKSAEFQGMEFRLIGDGPLFESTVAPLQGLCNVTIERGFLQQGRIAELQHEYGIFLSPTRWDSQGVSRDEAMAAGLVPVTNAVAAVPEFVSEDCGILAPPEDAKAMASGILRLVRDPELFRAMSRAAAERVRCQSAGFLITPQEINLMRPSDHRIIAMGEANGSLQSAAEEYPPVSASQVTASAAAMP